MSLALDWPLSRKWAINCKLNPVFYYQEKSILFDEFSSMMALQHEDFTSMSNQEMLVKSVRDTYLKSRYIMQFYKPWYGYDFKINKEKSFYDEREWRYIPIQENGYESIYNDSEEFHARREEYYERLLNPVLIFEPRDITYIVLENESERYELIMQIRRIKERYSFRDVETLVSRIITAEQISSDI